MHSVLESAIGLREQKRAATAERITLCALRLTDERGLDGFTMDDLAEAAEVSRRTLFNYFPGKVDAVLGELPGPADEVVDTFRSGGPHGTLVEDLAELGRAALATKPTERATLELSRRVLVGEPRLLAAVHERFEVATEQFAELVREREGADFDPVRARLALRLLLAVLDHALTVLVEERSDRTIVNVLDEQLALARDLLA